MPVLLQTFLVRCGICRSAVSHFFFGRALAGVFFPFFTSSLPSWAIAVVGLPFGLGTVPSMASADWRTYRSAWKLSPSWGRNDAWMTYKRTRGQGTMLCSPLASGAFLG
jgi:hypothetical protein